MPYNFNVFITLLYLLFICAWVGYGYTHVTVRMCRSEDSMQELGLTFLHPGPRNRMQIERQAQVLLHTEHRIEPKPPYIYIKSEIRGF